MWFRRHLLGICIALTVLILLVGAASILGFLALNVSLVLAYSTSVLGVLVSAWPLLRPPQLANQPPPPPPRRNFFSLGLLILLILLSILSLPLMVYAGYYSTTYIASTCDNFTIYQPRKVFHLDSGSLATHVDRMADNECVGISDGDFAFDTLRPDGSAKIQAATTFRSNSSDHIDKAVAQWNNAAKMESNDAEPLIYMEDLSVLKDYTSLHRQYYDVIAVTMLTGSSDSVNIGRDNLQGFYVAQNEGLLALSALKAANYTNLFLGGDALYQLRSSFFEMYPPFADSMLRFTAFVYPDEPIAALNTFNALYSAIFGADQKEHPSPYGFTRADNDAILSYDALLTLRTALDRLGSRDVSTQALREVLVTIDKNNPVQGASGPIYFVSADGHASSDAQNKKVLVVCVAANGRGYPCG